MNELCRFTRSYSIRKSLWTLNLIYLNGITEYDMRYELVELKMELANSTSPKCQFQFQFHPFWLNSNSIKFRIKLTPALIEGDVTCWTIHQTPFHLSCTKIAFCFTFYSASHIQLQIKSTLHCLQVDVKPTLSQMKIKSPRLCPHIRITRSGTCTPIFTTLVRWKLPGTVRWLTKHRVCLPNNFTKRLLINRGLASTSSSTSTGQGQIWGRWPLYGQRKALFNSSLMMQILCQRIYSIWRFFYLLTRLSQGNSDNTYGHFI